MERLTEQRLGELEVMYAKATPPPWKKRPRVHYDMFASVFGSDNHLIVNLGDGGNGIERQTANADLIIAIVNAFPALAAAARNGLQAEKYRKALEEIESFKCEDGGPRQWCMDMIVIARQALTDGGTGG